MREQPYDGLSFFGKSEISQRCRAAALCRGGVAHAPEDTPVLSDAQMERRALSELSTLSSSPVQTNVGTEGDKIVSSSPESRRRAAEFPRMPFRASASCRVSIRWCRSRNPDRSTRRDRNTARSRCKCGGALRVTWSQVSSAFGRRSADVRGDANICYGGRRLIARDFKAWCEVWSKTTRACAIFIRSAELRADREWRNRFGAIHESASIL